jgi:hypothetical protein
MRTVKVEVWDDLDHEIPADQTRTIGIDGVWYELDLSDVSAKELDEALARFRERGRRIGGKPRSTKIRDTEAASAPAPPDGADAPPSIFTPLGASRLRNKRIRAWAEKQPGLDLDLSDSWKRGYIPVWVHDAYNKAHPDLALAET